MNLRHPAATWAAITPLAPIHIDCTTALMLKILDGKCRMSGEEKDVMAVVYDMVKERTGHVLDAGVHELIREARQAPDDALLMRVYEQRLLAETMISRPVMKAFKAMLRKEGILSAKDAE